LECAERLKPQSRGVIFAPDLPGVSGEKKSLGIGFLLCSSFFIWACCTDKSRTEFCSDSSTGPLFAERNSGALSVLR